MMNLAATPHPRTAASPAHPVRGLILLLAAILVSSCQVPPSTPAIASPHPPAEESKVPLVWRVDVRYFGDEERLAAVCLQGLANRQQARVFLDYGPSLRWLQIDYDRDAGNEGGRAWSEADAARLRAQYPDVCAYWQDFCQTRGICRFETVTLPQLIQALRPELKGVILYRTVADDLAVAATMAGVRQALPLTQALYDNWIAGSADPLPLLFDTATITAESPPGSDRRLAAHQWVLDHLFRDCRKSGAVSRDRTYGLAAHDTLVDIDLAVSQQWITFDLSYMSSESRSGGAKDKPNPVWGFDPPDKPLLIAILRELDTWAPVYGWGRPYESALVRRLALHDCVKVCGGTGNGSFFRGLPRLAPDFRQPAGPAGPVVLEQKYYVAFMTNEGDTLKSAASLVNGGTWLQSERGQLPINWGIDPLLVRDVPGLMSYYYRTATANDYFFSAPSGWGYLAPEMLADGQIGPYGQQVAQGAALADTRYGDVWWMGGLRKRGQFFPLLAATGMRGLTQWSGRQQVEFAPDGTPVIHSNYYYARFRPEELARRLEAETAEVAPPWFIVIYAGNPHWFAELAKRLPAERFKIVKLDEFFEAARLARPQVEGRVWQPPRNTPATVVP